MANYKIITITGLDRVGKETQSLLLQQVLTPSQRLEFPDYGHWSGQIIRAILNEETFSLSRGCEMTGAYAGIFQEGRDPEVFQLLQTLGRQSAQSRIARGLRHHHWIMDRYDIDALAYGRIDGCDPQWIRDIQSTQLSSDLVLVFLGTPFPREDELDAYERDQGFQQRVWQAYEELAQDHPDWIFPIYTDSYRDTEKPWRSKAAVHQRVCEILNQELNLGLEPLDAVDILRHDSFEATGIV